MAAVRVSTRLLFSQVQLLLPSHADGSRWTFVVVQIVPEVSHALQRLLHVRIRYVRPLAQKSLERDPSLEKKICITSQVQNKNLIYFTINRPYKYIQKKKVTILSYDFLEIKERYMILNEKRLVT